MKRKLIPSVIGNNSNKPASTPLFLIGRRQITIRLVL